MIERSAGVRFRVMVWTLPQRLRFFHRSRKIGGIRSHPECLCAPGLHVPASFARAGTSLLVTWLGPEGRNLAAPMYTGRGKKVYFWGIFLVGLQSSPKVLRTERGFVFGCFLTFVLWIAVIVVWVWVRTW